VFLLLITLLCKWFRVLLLVPIRTKKTCFWPFIDQASTMPLAYPRFSPSQSEEAQQDLSCYYDDVSICEGDKGKFHGFFFVRE
jgi:hypothetical protein